MQIRPNPLSPAGGFEGRHPNRGGFQSAGSRKLSVGKCRAPGRMGLWRQTAGDFGFGRTELLPVKSCAEAVAVYIGKYIGKSITCRTEQDKGVRLVEYSKDARMASSRFQFVSSGSAQWRRKVALFAQIVAKLHGKPINSLDDLAETLGSRWAYNNRPFISALPDSEEIEIQEEEATTAQNQRSRLRSNKLR